MAAAPSKKKSPRHKSNDGLRPKKAPMKSSKRKLERSSASSEASHKPTKSSKHFSKRNLDQSSDSALLQFEDDVPNFPRGGGCVLTRHEEEEIRAEVDAEFEAEQGDNKKRRKHRDSYTTPDDLGTLFGDRITGSLPRYANKITLKNIAPGMKLLGTIVEVNPKDLVVSLPGGLRGYVHIEEASDLILGNVIKVCESTPSCSTFVVGQLVSCIVLSMDDDKMDGKGNNKIWLSLRLALLHKGLTLDSVQDGMVLSAYVKSIEDHGYILQFGVSSFSGFLPRKSQGDGLDINMSIGQLIQGVVKSIDKTRGVLYLNSNLDLVSKSVVRDVQGLSIDLLIPGMMVNARVISTLENGVILSFLTYFTGTVDIFHLQNPFPNSTWKNDYVENKKVNARILFIDPSTRAIGLTMNTHLVQNKAPVFYVKAGDIYDSSRIVRIDKGFGLLLEISSSHVPTPAYVRIFDVVDGEVRKLEKKFKEGSHVRVRVVGFKHLEGLATGSLKASVFEGPAFTHADVKPGMVVNGKVISVENYGAIVHFSNGMKALCPIRHMSELEIVKPAKKFKVGTELCFRVLGCKSKRITVTHKKTLVKSKLKILSSYADASDGLVTHGWIARIEKNGCYVKFYNGVHGFAHRSELGLDPGSEASSTYHVGQVVKCRIISAVSAARKINLSFVTSSKRALADGDTPTLGSLVFGVVTKLTPSAVIIDVNGKAFLKGSISNEHLADHQGQATTLKSILKPGYKFDSLLVIDLDGSNFVLSGKYSLINAVKQIPSEIANLQLNTVVHGYICNSIEAGYFVRYLGRLTGFASKTKATDGQKIDSSDPFYIGQSVRSQILKVDGETGKIAVSLKQSSCFSVDASFIQGYFLLEEKIAHLQSPDSSSDGFEWAEKFNIGSVVEGEVQEIREFGAVLSFKERNDVVGFIANEQMGGRSLDISSTIQASVLDISKAECLLDLSLKPELLFRVKEDEAEHKPSKKKHRREVLGDLEVHQTVNAVVEVVKENYLVLSIPEYRHTIGYASVYDYNTQKLPFKSFVTGQSVVAAIEALPGTSTAGRLLLLLKSLSEAADTSSSKRAKRKSSYKVGSLVEAEITDINPLEMRVKFGIGFYGRVHISEVTDKEHSVDCPFENFRVGQQLTARIVATPHQSTDGKKRSQWELSVKPSVIAGSQEIVDELLLENYSVGNEVTAYVIKVDSDWVWLTVSRHLKAMLFVLDSSCEPSELQEAQKRFYVGKAVRAPILSINKEKRLLRLTLNPSYVRRGAPSFDEIKMHDQKVTDSNSNYFQYIIEGDTVGGRITKILPGVGGLYVQIAPHQYGKVHFTELTDKFVADPLNGYHEGQFVKCKVLDVIQSFKGTKHIDLSLRNSLISLQSDDLEENDVYKRFVKIEELHPNMDLQGYVKDISSKGCFIMISQKIDAKILLSNLSDHYVENPEHEFPIGKLVNGKVLSVEPLSKRVRMTLKTTTVNKAPKSEIGDLSLLTVGGMISGRIRRIESYGLFITIDNTNMVGLCHISELPDSHVQNINSKYSAGERVVAKILKVDKERNRISLGMKESYARNSSSLHVTSDDDHDGNISDSQPTTQQDGTAGDPRNESADDDLPVIAQANSRASVPPLEVKLDEMEDCDLEDAGDVAEEKSGDQKTAESIRRREKKRAKEEREKEIRAAEERLLRQDTPKTADEFEKLVRCSPNSSFVWIKYMAFMLSMADVEKARSIAERALQTINFREEGEKLNIWVAYFNLENEYGIPPEEAVMKTFQRALQYCDPKKLHLALLGVYERTNQYKLVEELLDKMTRKFKSSCKVWLRRVQNFLKQGKDGVQSIINCACISLPRHKHIKFISQAAILEFKFGVADRGRAMFDTLVKDYPKRTDLWSIYLDQVIRLGDTEVIRNLFERATCLSLPPKKMKFLFKKYLEYEKSCGDDERIEYVKSKAMEYVQNSLS